jgi:hypothetical protein
MERLDHELTECIQQRIYKALRMGASYELAARYAGIPVKWFWRWKKDGEEDQASFNKDYRKKCMDFSREIKQARADYEMTCLTRMEQLGLKHFKPLHWKYEQLSALRSQGETNNNQNKKRRSERHENKNSHKTV